MKNLLLRLSPIFMIAVLLNIGCSSYVSRVHQQIDREYQQMHNPNARAMPSTDTARQAQQGPSTQNSSFQPPSVQRQYQSSQATGSVGLGSSQGQQRTRAEDLRDNTPSTSLWASNESNLFSHSRRRSSGDIVLINVMDRLKKEISLELRRNFPPPRRQQRDQQQEEDEQQEEGSRDVAQEGESRIHDRISSVIIEQISRDHVLLRGRKNVLFQNARRLIEVQALVATRDIDNNDSIKSDDIIESQVTVLR